MTDIAIWLIIGLLLFGYLMYRWGLQSKVL